MAYSMPVPMSKEDENRKALHDICLGSPKAQQGNSSFRIRHIIPNDTSNSSRNASNSRGNTSNSNRNASNNSQQ